MNKKCIQRPDFTNLSSVISPQPWTPPILLGGIPDPSGFLPSHNFAQSKEGPFWLFVVGGGAKRCGVAVHAVTNKAHIHEFVPKLKLFFI